MMHWSQSWEVGRWDGVGGRLSPSARGFAHSRPVSAAPARQPLPINAGARPLSQACEASAEGLPFPLVPPSTTLTATPAATPGVPPPLPHPALTGP